MGGWDFENVTLFGGVWAGFFLGGGVAFQREVEKKWHVVNIFF